jgi:glutamine amidotransferase
LNKTISLLDYGVGNLCSVMNAFEHLGVRVIATNNQDEICSSSGIVIPGVGAFGSAMDGMKKYGLDGVVQDMARLGKPILGICVGFQMLMASSFEMGVHEGLNFFMLRVEKIPTSERLPHIGWSNLYVENGEESKSILLRGIENPRFYFLHSYAPIEMESNFSFSTSTNYGGCKFISLVERGNIFGTQFHPEKSGECGLALLKNFSDYALG